MTTLTDRTVLVTGSTDGLGRALARAVAEAGGTVLLHGRDPGRGEQALAEVRDANPDGAHDLYLADLASLQATRELADRVADDHDRLHVLVNNAGVGFHPVGDTSRQESADGHELHLAVNYLAPVLLTRRLAPLLAARPRPAWCRSPRPGRPRWTWTTSSSPTATTGRRLPAQQAGTGDGHHRPGRRAADEGSP